MFKLLCFAFFPLAVTAQGIQFEHNTWAETLAKAKVEKKIIFVDAYTSWCGPCKAMARDVFPVADVGTFYNTHFLNVKMDMEKGEGIDLSNQYKVWAYPTLLFVDGDGKMVHRSTGFHEVEAFLTLGKTALDTTQNLASMDKKYAAGDRSNAFVTSYLSAKSAAYDPEAGAIAEAYLTLPPGLETPENRQIAMQFLENPNAPLFKKFLEKRPAFEQQFGRKDVALKIESVFNTYFDAQPAMQLADIDSFYWRIYPEQAAQLASAHRLYWYNQNNDAPHYMEAALDYFARFPSDDPVILHEAAWVFCSESNDPVQLKTALGWAQRAVTLEESFYNQFTLAKLLAKTGDNAAAKKAAERSLSLGKAAGEDMEMVEAFLAGLR